MIYWILLFGSATLIFLMFLRQARVVWRDRFFQKNLEAEQASEVELEIMAQAMQEKTGNSPQKGGIRSLFMKGDAHLKRGEHEAAKEHFLLVIDRDPSHFEAHHKLGMLFMKLEDFANAELYFSKLINLKKDPVVFSNLGAALYKQQRLIEAAEAYENAIAMDSKRAERLQSLAQVYFELGDDENAVKYFEMATKRKPKDPELKHILAEHYMRMQRYPEALETYKKLHEASPYDEEIKAKIEELRGH